MKFLLIFSFLSASAVAAAIPCSNNFETADAVSICSGIPTGKTVLACVNGPCICFDSFLKAGNRLDFCKVVKNEILIDQDKKDAWDKRMATAGEEAKNRETRKKVLEGKLAQDSISFDELKELLRNDRNMP